MKRVRAIVRGKVQGVWFRAHTQERARELAVRGWVRNLPGGEVELVAAGEETAVDALLAWAGEGPPLARVSAVEVEPLDPGVPEPDFEIRY